MKGTLFLLLRWRPCTVHTVPRQCTTYRPHGINGEPMAQTQTVVPHVRQRVRVSVASAALNHTNLYIASKFHKRTGETFPPQIE